MKINKKIVSLLLIVVLLVPFVVTIAADADKEADIAGTIKSITTWMVNIAVAVAILMYIVAGFFWMSDAGNAERAKMAKSIVVSTTIGLIIVLMAAGLANVIKGFIKYE